MCLTVTTVNFVRLHCQLKTYMTYVDSNLKITVLSEGSDLKNVPVTEIVFKALRSEYTVRVAVCLKKWLVLWV